MLKKSKRIPIIAAESIGRTYNKSQVIVVTFDETGTTTVTTWGKTLKDCEQAAIGGNFVKKACGFPEEKCNDKPARTQKKMKQKCNCITVEGLHSHTCPLYDGSNSDEK